MIPEPGFGQIKPEGSGTGVVKTSSASEFGSTIKRKMNSADSSGGDKEKSNQTNLDGADQTDILNLSRVDTCLIRMEELEMEVNGIL
jgi:hypothetical protein